MDDGTVESELLRTLGDNIRRAREELGWTQLQLAAEAKVDKRIIGRLEQHRGGCTLERAAVIASALDADLALLLDSDAGADFGKARAQVSTAQVVANVVAKRKEKGFSQAAMATRAGTHANYISRLETSDKEAAKTSISIQTLERLATALDVKPGSLL
jgi:transcriptional regulator with XRE-family HTH domain